MDEPILAVEYAPEGGFTARARGASIFTEADDASSLRERAPDAVRRHFDEGSGPKAIRPRFASPSGLARAEKGDPWLT
jgi:hypothetical protein